MQGVLGLVVPSWPPLRHVERGWAELTPAEQEEVARRVEDVMAKYRPPSEGKDAHLHLFAFLAQVETIAIEIPLRFLPGASDAHRALLRRQLVDEVFHSTLFCRLAYLLALPQSQPPPPLASAERLLDKIRHQKDLAITATLLNLVAEGWIETLFRHALRWKVANPVFRAVLADEARHVDEASRYLVALDTRKAQAAVEAFERGMLEVSAEPSVALAIRDLAGASGQDALGKALFKQHERHLRAVGLAPSPQWTALMAAVQQLPTTPMQEPKVVPDTHWRRIARQVWTTPRDPTMHGDVDIPIGHVPRRDLTPICIAALGRAWAKHPELNRVVARDKVWQLPMVNVGVRVLLDDDELATVIVTEADKRSVRDIRRILVDGVAQLNAARQGRRVAGPDAVADPNVAALAPAMSTMFAVAISNAGKWGVVSGAGSLSGWVSASTDFTFGVRRRLPVWRAVAYVPAWHINAAAVQDHRVMDGRASATAVTALQEALSKKAVREIRARPDTLPPEAATSVHGSTNRRAPSRHPGASAAAMIPMGDPNLVAANILGLGKYAPVVLGGAAVGAVGGVAGYMLYQNLNNPALAGSGAAGHATGNTGAGKQAQEAAPSLADGGREADKAKSTKKSPDASKSRRPAAAGKAKPRPGRKGRSKT